jgi:hypothetical protein
MRHTISHREVLMLLLAVPEGGGRAVFRVPVWRDLRGREFRINAGKPLRLLPAVDALMAHAGYRPLPGLRQGRARRVG